LKAGDLSVPACLRRVLLVLLILLLLLLRSSSFHDTPGPAQFVSCSRLRLLLVLMLWLLVG
jgi:hypothetical protein